MDGLNAFPDAQTGWGKRGDESECTRLQHEASYEHYRNSKLAEGDGGVKSRFSLPQKALNRYITALKRQ